MEQFKLGEMEMKFAEIIWEHEPVKSGNLVKLCEEKLSWKKSTTYTMLKRLCAREIFKNEKGLVTCLMTKETFLLGQSEQFISDTYQGSLPSFFAAFTRKKKLSKDEIDEIQALIDACKEDE